MTNRNIDQEAEILARYLIGQPAGKQTTGLYKQAIAEISPNRNEQLLIDFAFDHPHLIGALDGGLAILSPGSELRRRIYIMFAILEATPEYSSKFLPRKRHVVNVPVFILAGAHAVLRAIFGIIVIKATRLQV